LDPNRFSSDGLSLGCCCIGGRVRTSNAIRGTLHQSIIWRLTLRLLWPFILCLVCRAHRRGSAPERRTCVATTPSSVEPVRQYALLLLHHVGMTRRAAEKTIGCLAPSRFGATAVDTPSRCGGEAFAAWTAASGRLDGTFHCRPWPSLAFGMPPCCSPCPPCRILSVLHSKRSSRWPPRAATSLLVRCHRTNARTTSLRCLRRGTT
jgi:hypothetical protein